MFNVCVHVLQFRFVASRCAYLQMTTEEKGRLEKQVRNMNRQSIVPCHVCVR